MASIQHTWERHAHTPSIHPAGLLPTRSFTHPSPTLHAGRKKYNKSSGSSADVPKREREAAAECDFHPHQPSCLTADGHRAILREHRAATPPSSCCIAECDLQLSHRACWGERKREREHPSTICLSFLLSFASTRLLPCGHPDASVFAQRDDLQCGV